MSSSSSATTGQATHGVSYSTVRYHIDPIYKSIVKENAKAYVKARRERDPEYDAQIREHWRAYTNKYLQDPEKAAKKREYQRQWYLKQKAEKHQEIIV